MHDTVDQIQKTFVETARVYNLSCAIDGDTIYFRRNWKTICSIKLTYSNHKVNWCLIKGDRMSADWGTAGQLPKPHDMSDRFDKCDESGFLRMFRCVEEVLMDSKSPNELLAVRLAK